MTGKNTLTLSGSSRVSASQLMMKAQYAEQPLTNMPPANERA